jgi:hypothetical protein
VHQATIRVTVVTIWTIVKAASAIATITKLLFVIGTTNTMIALDMITRTQKAPGPTTRRMIASAITPRKRAMRPCIMTSPLSQALTICPERGVDLLQDLLHALNLGLALAQAARATNTITLTKMIASKAQPPSTSTCTPPRVTMADAFIALTKAIAFLLPFLL